jgi:1-acyl-sn-glycerol-3-phosphate acyltransferase
LIFFARVYWIKIERPKIDYKKWLGPDWEPSYDNASTYVVNHQIWIDILVFMWWNLPSFVSKREVRKMPGVGKIAESI